MVYYFKNFCYNISRVTLVSSQDQQQQQSQPQQQQQTQRIAPMIMRKMSNGRVVFVNQNVSASSQLATINKTTVSNVTANSTNQRGGPR